MRKNNLDLVGKTFNEWIVLRFGKFIQRKTSDIIRQKVYTIDIPYWLCRCSCGREKYVREKDLINGASKCCGHRIINQTHGLSRTPEYIVWNSMRHRCNKNNSRCKDYFYRNIRVCQFLNESVINFISIIGKRPDKSFDLDRINNDGHYSCGSCNECIENNWPLNIRWLTHDENMKNRRPTELEICGTIKSCYDWALEYKALRESEQINKYIL